MEEMEVRIALTTEPVGRHQWQWVVVFASAEEIVRIDRSEHIFSTVAEALAAGQVAINALRLRGGWQTSQPVEGQAAVH